MCFFLKVVNFIVKFMVGLKNNDRRFLDCIIKNKIHIQEVYFSWGDFPNGRSNQLMSDDYTPWELMDIQKDMLRVLSDNNIRLNLLFNANCYGKDSMSRVFFHKVGCTVDYIQTAYGLSSVTTTSPLIAKFIKDNFADIEVRASVNMEIGTVDGMEYISAYFDGYYMKRELNHNFGEIEKLSRWCRSNAKKLYMLANSGCLNNCSVHNFHDNLVAHEDEIAKMDNAYSFHGMCREFLKNEANYPGLIDKLNFVRPEDIQRYEKYFDGIKLATRTNRNPVNVLESYIKRRYRGNVLSLLEPEHNIYPYVIENGESLKLVKVV